MAGSKRVLNAKSEKYHDGIHTRGKNKKKEKSQVPVGPFVLGFFLFVVVGSAVLQIIRALQSGEPA